MWFGTVLNEGVSRHRRPALQRQNPAMKTGEISGLLSAEWKGLEDVSQLTLFVFVKLIQLYRRRRGPIMSMRGC